MWRLWHKLFGWEYALIRWAFCDQKIVRLRKTPNGEHYYRIYGETRQFEQDRLIMRLTNKEG